MAELKTVQIIGIVVGCLVLVGGPTWIAYSYFGSRRTVASLTAEVGGALGLVRTPASATIFQDRRGLVGFAPQPVAQGKWNGVPVELTYEPKAGALMEKSTTRVTLVWPTSIARAGMDRHQTLNEPNDLIERHPHLGKVVPDTENGLRWAKDPWFGPSMVWGTQADLDRVLGPGIRAKLKSLPRQLSVVFFHDRVMVIEWYELERDPAIVRQALDLGVACLEELAPRSN